MNHIVRFPFGVKVDSYDTRSLVTLTRNTCPCSRCRTWRRHRRNILNAHGPIGTFDIAKYAHVEALLDALIG